MKFINGVIALIALIGALLASIVASIYVMYGVGYTVGYFTTGLLGGSKSDIALWFAWFGAAFPLLIILVFLFAIFVGVEDDELSDEDLVEFNDMMSKVTRNDDDKGGD